MNRITRRLALVPMRTLLLFLGTLAATACSAGSGARATRRADVVPPAVDSVPRTPVEPVAAADDTLATEPADRNLSGAWVTGSTNEPPVRRIVSRPQCNYRPGFWSLQQSGDTVRAWTIPESRAQGIALPVRPSPQPVEGRLVGAQLVMSQGTSRYRLHYDSASGHLRGTLNGAPFWAVRLQIVQPHDCIPVP